MHHNRLASLAFPPHIEGQRCGAEIMAGPISVAATRIAYGATQLPRLAWYVGQGVIMRELARRQAGERARAAPTPGAPSLGNRQLYANIAQLLRRDLANVEAGIYPLPADRDGSLLSLLRRSQLFFADLPVVHRRRERRGTREVATQENAGKRPDYYLQNFHFQSGGWMTRDSARRYDTQVEVLFRGTANAIRRQALPPLHEVLAGRDQRALRFLDVGCGTGRFLNFFKQSWPRLPALGLDLSDAYIEEARHHLKDWGWLGLAVGKGEAMPVASESVDAAASVFLFHELPPKVRRAVLAEFARVLRRGGRLVLVDSLQIGDEPDYDSMLERFPHSFHEPYYASYLKEDFAALAKACGLTHVRDVNAYIAKVMVFDKV
jgi:ubiquinone/menaquinone biosynthesis C-methylase UbiE